MGRRKRKLTATEKAAKKKRQEEYETIFIRGKMKRVRRPPTVEGMSVEDLIRANADSIFLQQEEMWEDLEAEGGIDMDPGGRRSGGGCEEA
jgi:16S rRNA U516 pseudouridylate synthase RsuA-like enzyme